MKTDALAEAIGMAQSGDPAGFDWLVEAYGRRVYGFVYRLTGSRTDSEDLLQEVMLRVVRGIGEYEHRGRFESWLFRIAANLVRDRARRAQRRGEVEAGGDEERDDLLAAVPDTRGEEPGFRLHLGEEVDELRVGLSRLGEAEREVLMLRHFTEMTFREIAEMTGVPLGTTLARSHRALRKLREWMDPEGWKATGT